MPADWDAATNEMHLHNGRVSYVARVLEDGSLGHLYFGPALTPGRSYRHLGRRPFEGFSNRVGRAGRPGVPDRGQRRLPRPGARRGAGRRLDRPAPGLRRPPDPPRQARPPGPPGDLRRDRRRGRDRRDPPARTRRRGVEVALLYTIFADEPVVARSAHDPQRRGEHPVRRSLRDERRRWTSRTRAGTCVQLSGDLGARAPRRHPAAGPRPAVGRQPAGRVEPRAQPVRRPAPGPATTEEAGEAYGFSLVYSGNFLAEAEVDAFGATRVRMGINPETFAWTLEPGAELAAPEAVLVVLGRRPRRAERRLPPALPRAPRPRGLARPGAAGPPQQLGGDLLRLRRGRSSLEIATVARDLGIELFVLDDGWFGERDDDTTSLGDWFVDRRKLPGRPRGLARKVEALGLAVRPLDRARDGQPAEPALRGAPGLGDRRPGPARGRRAGSQLVLDMSRPEVVDHLFAVLRDVLRQRPDLLRQVGHEPQPHRAVPAPRSRADRQGEFFHRYILGVYDLYDRLDGGVPGDPLRVLRQRRRPLRPGHPGLRAAGLDQRRHRRGRAARASSGARRWPTRSARWAPTWRRSPTTRSVGVDAARHPGGRGVLRGLRLRAGPDGSLPGGAPRLADQVAFYKEHRALFQRGRFVRLRSPFEGAATRSPGWWSPTIDVAPSSAGIGSSTSRSRPPSDSGCGGSTQRSSTG